MTAYLYNAPNGIPGDVTRIDQTNIEPVKLIANNSVFAQAYGIPMKYVAGGVTQFDGSETAASFAGILTRSVPSQGAMTLNSAGAIDQSFGSGAPLPAQVQGFAVRGYVSVKCTIGTPVRGGVVYIRIVAATGKNIGDFEATADGSNNVALSTDQATWATDGVDPQLNAEIRIRR